MKSNLKLSFEERRISGLAEETCKRFISNMRECMSDKEYHEFVQTYFEVEGGCR